MKPELKIATVDGKRTLVANGRTLLTKQQVAAQIVALNERVATQLPAAKAKLDGKALLAQAQAGIDRQIAEATEIKAELESVLAQLD